MSVFGAFMANQAAKQDSEILELRAERDKLKAQRDALLAAAKAFMSDPHADLCSYVNLDFVRAAIEEAEK